MVHPLAPDYLRAVSNLELLALACGGVAAGMVLGYLCGRLERRD